MASAAHEGLAVVAGVFDVVAVARETVVHRHGINHAPAIATPNAVRPVGHVRRVFFNDVKCPAFHQRDTAGAVPSTEAANVTAEAVRFGKYLA